MDEQWVKEFGLNYAQMWYVQDVRPATRMQSMRRPSWAWMGSGEASASAPSPGNARSSTVNPATNNEATHRYRHHYGERSSLPIRPIAWRPYQKYALAFSKIESLDEESTQSFDNTPFPSVPAVSSRPDCHSLPSPKVMWSPIE